MTYPEKYDVEAMDSESGFPELKPAELVIESGGVSKELIETVVGSSSSSPTKWATGGTITSGGMTISGASITLTPPVPKSGSRVISAPGKSPRKVLVAFLDENDEVEWCAKVRPDQVETKFNGGDAPEMWLAFKLVEADPR